MATRLERTIIIAGAIFACLFLLPRLLEDKTGDLRISSLSNLKQLGSGLSAYTRDHHGTLPPMQDALSFRDALGSLYVRDPRLYYSPLTGTPFRPNATASERNIRSISEPAQFVVLYESTPSRRYKFSMKLGRCVLFLNGKVGWINEKQWPRLRRLSQLP